MASRPDLTEFRVAPSTGRLPVVRAPQVQNQSGQQLQQMGRAIENTGGALTDLAIQRLKETNELVANDAITRAKELELQLAYGEDGWSRQKGFNAIHRPSGKSLSEEYGTAYSDGLSSIAGDLKNDAQRAMFNRFRQQSELQLRERLDRHYDNEFVAWSKSNIDGSVAMRQDEIRLGWDDPARVRDAVAAIPDLIRRRHALDGLAATEIEALTKRAIGVAIADAVEGMIDEGKWRSAEGLLNEYRNSMDADSITEASQKLDGEVRFQMATQIADDAVRGAKQSSVGFGPETLIPPLAGNPVVTSGMGQRARPKAGASTNHRGVDYGVPVGTPVSAAGSGTATYLSQPKGAGNYVKIDHGGGVVSYYMHLDDVPGRKHGDTWEVRQGETFAKSGNSGRSTGPHLHYEVRVNGKPVDPTVAHRTGGREGGPSTPAQTKREAYARAEQNPEYMNDPRVRRAVDARIESLFRREDYDRRRAEQETEDAAWRWVANNRGASTSQMPASLRNALARDNPRLLTQIQNAQEQALKPKPVDPMVSAVVTNELRQQIADGKITRPEQLIPHVSDLTAGDMKTLGAAILAKQKGDNSDADGLASTMAAIRSVDVELSGMGIQTTKVKGKYTDEYVQYRGAVLREIESAERIAGKQLSLEDKRTIALSLAAKTAVAGRFYGTNTVPVYSLTPEQRATRRFKYDYIPAAARERIEQDLRALGINATQQRVEAEYAERQRAGR